MTTYIAQIGNSDDKLTQVQWSAFIADLSDLLVELGVKIHFFGFAAPHSAWQNCCAVFEADADIWHLSTFQERLTYMAAAYGQDSIAVTIGTTVFVEARTS